MNDDYKDLLRRIAAGIEGVALTLALILISGCCGCFHK